MRPVLLAILLLAATPWAPGDEVYLRDGRVLEGEVLSKPEDAVVSVRRGSGSMVVVQHVPADQVDKIVFGKNDRQRGIEAVRAEVAALGDGGEAEAWWALSERARDLGDAGLARELAQQVVARDRRHQGARRLLAMSLVHGVWMRANEAAVATGQMLIDGRWMTWSERQAQQAELAKRQEAVVARKKAADERRAARASATVPYGPIDVPGYGAGYSAGYSSGYGLNRYSYNPGLTYPANAVPTIVTWPGCYAPTTVLSGGSGLSVAASGSSGSSSWSVRWNW